MTLLTDKLLDGKVQKFSKLFSCLDAVFTLTVVTEW